MLQLATAVAVLSALGMAACAVLLVRRTVRIPLVAVAVGGGLAIAVAVLLAEVTGAMPGWVAASIASGALPVVVPLIGVLRAGPSAVAASVGAVVWAAIVVPAGIVLPPLVTRACGGGCAVEDFGGGLPLAIGAGAFLIVPSAVTIGRNRMRSGTGSRAQDVIIACAFWAAFVLWLVALEGDIDDYTGTFAAAALLGPATGAVGWFLADRIRGVRVTARRGLRLGLLAGMGGILPGVAAVALPWTLLIGILCGAAGALAHDSRGMQGTPPATRAAVAALVVGGIGMIAPGIVGSTLGFFFAARVDVLLAQLAAALAVTALAIAVSVPVALLLRGGRESQRE